MHMFTLGNQGAFRLSLLASLLSLLMTSHSVLAQTSLPSPLGLPLTPPSSVVANRQPSTPSGSARRAATSIRYVKAGAPAAGGGTSWSDASSDLQAMINASASGDQVWIAGGTYKPSTAGLTDPREASFSLKSGVSVLGGFTGTAGTEGTNNTTTRTAIPSSTTISGDIGDPGVKTDNCYHVFLHVLAPDNTALLDGVTITGGYADPSKSNGNGGGMYNTRSNPTLINCLFIQNSASAGGGLYNEGNNPTVTNCSFIDNSSLSVGAGSLGLGAQMKFINCFFSQNSTESFAGGLALYGESSADMINCTFSNNIGYGGAILVTAGATANLVNCLLWNEGGQDLIRKQVNTDIVTAKYCLIGPGETDYTDGGNNQIITRSPFSTANGPQLLPCAPAVDAGNDAAYTTTTATDVLGNNRQVRTIDIGAAEFQGTPTSLSFSVAAQPNPICVGSTTTLSIPVIIGKGGLNPPFSYSWVAPAGATLSSPNQSPTSATAISPGVLTFSISLTDAVGCQASNTISVTANALPTPYSVTGGGAYCAGGAAPRVGLSSSQTGFSYQLLRGGSPVGASQDGTGSPIDFGPQSTTGTYSVQATNATTGCRQIMNGSVGVSINALPQAPMLATQSGHPYPAGASSLTISQNTGNVILLASGCPGGTISWSGGNSSTLAVPTTTTGLQTFTATCTNNTTGCTSPLATATVTVVPPTLRVFSRDPDNGQLNSNTIKPYLLLQNVGSTPIAYQTITVRYWLTTENNIPLLFQKNYVQIGAGNVQLRYVPLSPGLAGATGYVEYSFSGGAGSLAAGSSSGPIETQFSKQNYSAFNQLDDYSYINNSAYTLNPRITAYQNGVIFYGQEPGVGGSPRIGVGESGLVVRVLGNPVMGQTAEVEVLGAEGQPVQMHLFNLQGRLLYHQSISQAGAIEQVSVPLGAAHGLLLLQVRTPTQGEQVKLLKR